MKYWYRFVIFIKRVMLQKKQKCSLLGDISDCTFDAIKAQLSSMSFQVFNSTDDKYKVRFWDVYTEYVLSFTSGGKVIQIELEHWKEAGIKFKKKLGITTTNRICFRC